MEEKTVKRLFGKQRRMRRYGTSKINERNKGTRGKEEKKKKCV